MEQALYAPGLGYYAAGAQKFGSGGDFVTAPEMTALFGQALAVQVDEILAASAPRVIEAGAGSGRLAADLLAELERRGRLPETYGILELSAELRERQRATLANAVPHLLPRVEWLSAFPESFSGAVLANEVLDAMPVHGLAWRAGGIFERGVGMEGDRFVWRERPATGRVLAVAEALSQSLSIPLDYESEIGLAAAAWTASWGSILDAGALLLIDYGFPRREFYHPQRDRGTLMAHDRHRAHPDVLARPGLQDITAHVDFTAIVAAAHEAGLELLGYTNQGRFLLNCGILDRLSAQPAGSPEAIRAAGAVNRLIQPHEMGELFKVMAVGRGLASLAGFSQGDQGFRL